MAIKYIEELGTDPMDKTIKLKVQHLFPSIAVRKVIKSFVEDNLADAQLLLTAGDADVNRKSLHIAAETPSPDAEGDAADGGK